MVGEGVTTETYDDFRDYVRDINDIIEPGMPVVLKKIQNYNQFYSRKRGLKESYKKFLFISDGSINSDGLFNIQKGEQNYSSLLFGEGGLMDYTIVNFKTPELYGGVLSVPKDDIEISVEKDSSINDKIKWTSTIKSQNTTTIDSISMGDISERLYSDALDALHFARDAVYFNLDPFYFSSHPMVRRIDDSKTKMSEAREFVCLSAVLSLLHDAKHKHNGGVSFVANQLGTFSTGSESWQKHGHPVCDTDYLIQQGNTVYAYVKTGCGFNGGATYILPTSKDEDLVERAFSDDFVKNYYPAGFIE